MTISEKGKHWQLINPAAAQRPLRRFRFKIRFKGSIDEPAASSATFSQNASPKASNLAGMPEMRFNSVELDAKTATSTGSGSLNVTLAHRSKQTAPIDAFAQTAAGATNRPTHAPRTTHGKLRSPIWNHGSPSVSIDGCLHWKCNYCGLSPPRSCPDPCD